MTDISTVSPEIAQPPMADPERAGVFEFTDDRKFQLYMQQRKGYQDGARDAYQRFDQTVVALSGGTIVLSITFLKDIGHVAWSIPWLVGSWAAFLGASYCAFVSLRTSGESDRERMTQLDCQVESGVCDESRAERLGAETERLNKWALRLCIAGVVVIMAFALQNFVVMGGGLWLKRQSLTVRNDAGTASAVSYPTEQPPKNRRSKAGATTSRTTSVVSSTGIQATQSPHP